MPSPLLVFDLDGTLVDTAPDLVDTLNVILEREGLAAVPYDEARKMIGGGARMLLERGLAAEGRSGGRDEVDRLYRDYVAYYADHLADRSRPFPGVEPALDGLASTGWRFAVCTNKLEWLSLRLLEALNLTDRFVAICGQDTFGVQKPNPAILLRTIERARGSAQCSIMVGDSINDIETAHAAHVPVIAVNFGYTDVPVERLGPDCVIEDYDQLSAAVAGLGRGWVDGYKSENFNQRG